MLHLLKIMWFLILTTLSIVSSQEKGDPSLDLPITEEVSSDSMNIFTLVTVNETTKSTALSPPAFSETTLHYSEDSVDEYTKSTTDDTTKIESSFIDFDIINHEKNSTSSSGYSLLASTQTEKSTRNRTVQGITYNSTENVQLRTENPANPVKMGINSKDIGSVNILPEEILNFYQDESSAASLDDPIKTVSNRLELIEMTKQFDDPATTKESSKFMTEATLPTKFDPSVIPRTKNGDYFTLNKSGDTAISLKILKIKDIFPPSKNIDIINMENHSLVALPAPDGNTYIYSMDFTFKVELIRVFEQEYCSFIAKGSFSPSLLSCRLSTPGDLGLLRLLAIKSSKTSYTFNLVDQLEGSQLLHYWYLDVVLHLLVSKATDRSDGNTSFEVIIYFKNKDSFKIKDSPLTGKFIYLEHFSVNKTDFIAALSTPQTSGVKQTLQLYEYLQSKGTYKLSQMLSVNEAHLVNFIGSQETLGNFIATYKKCYDGVSAKEGNIATIYKLESRKLNFYQNLAITAVPIQMTFLIMSGVPVISLVDFYEGVLFYANFGGHFVPIDTLKGVLSRPGFTRLHHFNKEIYALSSVNFLTESGLTFFEPKLMKAVALKEISAAVGRWTKISMVTLNHTSSSLSKEIHKAPIRGSTYNVTHTLIFKKNLTLLQKDAVVPIFDKESEKLIFNRMKVYKKDLKVLEAEVEQVRSDTSKCLNFSAITEWPGSYEMSSVVIRDGLIEDLFSESINNVSVPSEKELFGLTEGKTPFNINTMLFDNIEMKDVFVKEINSKPIGSYVTLNGDHVIKSRMKVRNLKVNNLNVSGLTDGIKMDSDSLLLSVGNQRIKGNLHCESAVVKNLQTETINGILLSDIFGTTINNHHRIIFKDLHIKGDLIFPGDLKVGTILGRTTKDLISNLLFSDSTGEQIIEGNISMTKASLKDLELKNALNNVPFSESVYINSPKMNYLVDAAVFVDVFAKKVAVSNSLNGIKVVDSELDIMTTTGDQIITGLKSFASVHLDGRLIKPQSKPGPEKLDEFPFLSPSELDAPTQLSGKLQLGNHFNSLSIIWGLVSSLVYDKSALRIREVPIDNRAIKIVTDAIDKTDNVLAHIKTTLDSPIYVDLDHLVQELEILHKIYRKHAFKMRDKPAWNKMLEDFNGRLLSFLKELNKVILTENETMKSQKLAESKHGIKYGKMDPKLDSKLKKLYHGPPKVFGLISGYDLEDIPRFNSSSYDDFTLSKIANAKKIILNKDLKANYINGVELQRIFTHALKLSERQTDLKYIFTNKIKVLGNLKVETLNNVPMKEYATTSGINVFQKDVTFKEPITAKMNIITKGKVNGYKISSEASRLALANGNQTILHPVVFKEVKSHTVKGEVVNIRGVPLNDFVLRNESALVTGKKIFSRLTFKSILLAQHLKAKTINGIDLSAINRFDKTVSGTVNMKGTASLTSMLVKGDIHVLKNLRGKHTEWKNLNSLITESVSTNKNVSFPGKLSFTGQVYAKDIIFTDTLDSVSAESFNEGWLPKKGGVVSAKTFLKNLKARKVAIDSNMLQGVDLWKLKTKTAKINEDATFKGKVYFENIVSPIGIEVDGLVQGHNLPRDSILNNGKVVIPAWKNFRKAILKGEISALGRVNNMNLRQICESAIGSLTISGSLHVNEDVFADKIKSLDDFFPMNANGFWLKDEPVLLKKVIFNEISAKQTFVHEELNRIAISKLTNNRKLECDKIVQGGMKFKKIITDLIDVQDIETKKLNGRSLDFLPLILLDDDQTFLDASLSSLSVNGELYLKGLINGQNFTDYCVKAQPCKINARKTFLADLNVEDAVILSEHSKINESPFDGLNSVHSDKVKIIVKGSLTVPSLRVDGDINGIKFDSDNLLTTYGQQSMTEALTISNPIDEGFALKADSVNSDSHTHNKFNLTEMYLFKKGTSMSIEDQFSIDHAEILSNYRSLKENSLLVSNLLRDQATSFNGWEVINTLKSHTHRITPILSGRIQDKSFSNSLAFISDDGIAIWNYSLSSKSYKDSGLSIRVPGNCTTDVKGFYKGSALFIATSANCVGSRQSEDLIMYTDNYQEGHQEFSYIWAFENGKPRMIAAISTASASQVQSLEIRGSGCFMFINEGTPNQILFCENNGKFMIRQKFKVGFAFQSLELKLNGEKFLIFASYLEHFYSTSRATIFKYNSQDSKYEEIQEIEIERLISISGGEFLGDGYLALIQKPFYGTSNGLVKIYRLKPGHSSKPLYDQPKFELEQKFSIDRPVQARFLQLPSYNFLLIILNESRVIRRYIKRGIEKFQKEGRMFSDGATSIETWTAYESTPAHFLAITAQEQKDNRYQERHSKILKAIFKGLH